MTVLDSLAGVVDSLQIPGGIEVRRRGMTGVDVDGEPAQGPLQRFTLCPVIVQPLGARDLLALPEGLRSAESVIVHSRRRLRTALETSGDQADVIVYKPGGSPRSFFYRVMMATDWSIIGGFYRCIATKQEIDDG